MKRCIRVCLMLWVPIFAFGQQTNYHVPLNVLSANQNGTRSFVGVPGPNYWQNHATYSIDVTVFPDQSKLSGSAEIRYYNESPDSLKILVFNVYQDIFRRGNSRDWDLGIEDLHDGTVLKNLKIGTEVIDTKNKRKFSPQGTKWIITPDRPLLPNDSLDIVLEWEVQLPSYRTIRMGKYSDRLLFVAYWYPQIAVYDDIDGWDMISYKGSVEFYNDFNSYDIRVEVPEDYGVWATGLLQQAETVFHPSVYERYQQAIHSDEVIQIIQPRDYRKGNVFIRRDRNVFHYIAQHVPDFSFVVAKELIWDGVGVLVDSVNHRRIVASALYHEEQKGFENVADYSRQSISYLSHHMPAIPFPYPQMTTVCNGRMGGGMETPMMANNGNYSDQAGLFGVTFHEIAHSYMPFYMGINEKKYAWMDEGWANLWPYELVDSLFPDYSYFKKMVDTYVQGAGTEKDIPPMVLNHLMGAEYQSLRLASYTRPALAYYFLQQAIGTELFKKGLHYYVDTWNGKHPLPTDFFHCMEAAADQSLDWFVIPWFYENAYPDLAIRKLTNNKQLVIENIGGLPLPVYVELRFTDGTTSSQYFPVSVWKENEQRIVIQLPEDKYVQEIHIGNDWIPDTNPENNHMLFID